MRLINVHTLQFAEYLTDEDCPRYVIASHRWYADEVSFKDVKKGRNKESSGYNKLEAFAKYTRENVRNIDWLWIDTCCINKGNDAELSSSINSMFRWYRNADLCIAYLSGVALKDDLEAFEQDVWFRRGWTLQELLAPRLVVFVSRDWQVIGNKGSSFYDYNKTPTGPDLTVKISKITNIPELVLKDWATGAQVSNEDKMKWIDARTTTLVEDTSYALFGIVGVTLPVIYGEGKQSARNRVVAELRRRDKVERAEVEAERRRKDDKEQHARKWQEIIAWLAPSNPWTNHESARRLHERSTGTWLLESRKYQAWKNGQGQCLWLYGGPGCGKTILCSTAIEDMYGYCADRRLGHAIFYFSFSDQQKQSYEDLLVSLVAQLASPEGFEVLEQAYEAKDRRRPGYEGLESILCKSLTSYDLIFCHLDALDECPEEDSVRRRLLERVEQLLARAENLRVLVTSRDEVDIRRSMAKLNSTSISVASELVTPDIQRYIQNEISRIPKLSRLDATTKNLVKTMLSERAGGMYVAFSPINLSTY